MQFDNNTTKVPASWMPFDESNTANNDTILTEVSALISTGKKTIEKSKRKQVKNACGKNTKKKKSLLCYTSF